ncbi:MAG: M56 family metallopeptidase [Planctomycetota bacterium]
MQGDQVFEHGRWLNLALVMALGTVAMVALASAVERLLRSAVWRRTLWQAVTAGVLALLLVELTGIGSALVGTWRTLREGDEEPVVESELPKAVTAMPSEPEASPLRSNAAEFEPQPLAVTKPTGETAKRDPDRQVEGKQQKPWTPRREASPRSTFGELAWPEPMSDTAGDIQEPREERSWPSARRVSPPRASELGQALIVAESDAAGPFEDERSPVPLDAAQPTPAPASAAVLDQKDCPVWDGWLAAIWLGGTVLVAGWVVGARALLWLFRRRHARVGESRLARLVASLSQRLEMRRSVTVIESATLNAPVAFGIFQWTIALPADFSEEFDASQQEVMLVHELSHLRAGDPFWKLLVDFSAAALWWHPLAWWTRRRLRAASEGAADEACLLVPQGPELLAGCLVMVGRRLSEARSLEWLTMVEPHFRSSLGRRVERLLSLTRRSPRVSSRRFLAALKTMRTLLPTLLVLFAVLCTARVRPRVTFTEGGTTMNMLTDSWRRSLAATTLVTLFSPLASDAEAGQPATRAMRLAVSNDKRPEQDQPRMERDAARDPEAREDQRRQGRKSADSEPRRGPERRQGGEGDRPDRKQPEREREEGLERLEHELHELEQKAEHIKRELGDRTPEQAPDLHHNLREVRDRMARIRREFEGEGAREREAREHEVRERDERERPERERERDQALEERLQHELHELEQKAEHIKRELGDRTPEQAPDLHHNLREVRDRMARIRREFEGEGAREREAREHEDRERDERERPERELRGSRFERGRRPAELLGERDRRELRGRAEGLIRKRKEMEERAELIKGLLEREDDLDSEPARRLREELGGIREQRTDLQRRTHELTQQLQGHPGPLPQERGGGGAIDGLRGRIRHLRVAVDNLRAAGMHEMAERLEEKADRLVEEQGQGLDEVARPRDRWGEPQSAGSGMMPWPRRRRPAPDQAVEELRDQMHELRHEMDELREIVEDALRR